MFGGRRMGYDFAIKNLFSSKRTILLGFIVIPAAKAVLFVHGCVKGREQQCVLLLTSSSSWLC